MSKTMIETLYTKQGRRYIPARMTFCDYDISIPVGGFVLIHASTDCCKSYQYEVKPDTAAFLAAATVAREAMEAAMIDASQPKPAHGAISKYTKRQLEIIQRFRAEMQDAGGLLPTMWQHTTACDVAEAGIKAVTEGKI